MARCASGLAARRAPRATRPGWRMGSSATVGRRSRRRERSTASSGARRTSASPRRRRSRPRLHRRPQLKRSPRLCPRSRLRPRRSRRRPARRLRRRQPSFRRRGRASSSIPYRWRLTIQALRSRNQNRAAPGSTPMNEIGRVDEACAAYSSLVLRSGAVGDASRRTFQVAPMVARAGPSPRQARGRLFEGSAGAEPPQDEVLGYGAIDKAFNRRYA